MDKLPSDARALLDAARHADDPSPQQRAHSDDALRAAFARRGIEGLPPLANVAAPAAHGRSGLGPRGWLAAKLGAGALAVVAATYFGVRSLRIVPHEAPRTRAHELAASPPAKYEAASAVAPATEVVRDVEQRAPANVLRRTDLHRPVRATDGSLQGELRTVAAVDALVRQERFADALRLLERSERESAAVLREERSALRILARCGIDPNPRARRERDRFLQASPHSVLADRVRSACTRANEGP